MYVPDESLALTAETYAGASLDQWQSAFWNLYGEVDSGIHMYDMMLQLVGDSAVLAEAVRKRSYIEAFPVMPRILSWLTTMVTKVAVQNGDFKDLGPGRSLAEIVWNKYPHMCYHCLQPRCLCVLTDVDAAKDARAKLSQAQREAEEKDTKAKRVAAIERAQAANKMPATLDGWVEMFDDVFGGANRTRSSAEKAFHFLEEIGEVERELRTADRIRAHAAPPRPLEWEDEIADVFSWLMTVFLHIQRRMSRSAEFEAEYHRITGRPAAGKSPLPTLSELVWAEFGSPLGVRCHRCLKTRCDMSTSFDGIVVDNRGQRIERAVIPTRR